MKISRVTELHYITPIIKNLSSILELGILSNRAVARIPHFSVASEEVQGRRDGKRIPGGLALHDYVNLYFDARNPMMYLRKGQRENLTVLRVKPDVLDIPGTVIADGNAASNSTLFRPSPEGLADLDEDRVYAEYWTDSNQWVYYEKKRQRCAEVLVPHAVPPEFVFGCYVCSNGALTVCRAEVNSLDVVVNSNVFFA